MKVKTIRTQLFIYIGIFSTFSIIIICVGIYLSYFKALKENESEYRIQLSSKTKQSVEFFLTLINNTSTSLSVNDTILNELNVPVDISNPNFTVSQHEINLLLQGIVSVQEYIRGIYILGTNNQFFTSDWGIKESSLREHYKYLVDTPMSIDDFYTNGSTVNYHMYSDSKVISFIKPIILPHTNKIIGIVIIDMNYLYLQEMFMASWMQSDEKILVVNHLGETLFSFPYNINLTSVIDDNPEIMENVSIQLQRNVFNKKSTILSDTLDYSKWKVIRIINSDNIYSRSNALAPIVIASLIILIIITWIISLLLSSSFTKPVRELMHNIQQVEMGNLNVVIPVTRIDELGQLGHSFNNMICHLNTLIKEMLENQKKKSDMAFQILQAQINPHFLYNTLDSIKWLAVIQNVDNIGQMTTSLINLLKYNLSPSQTLVAFSEEIQNIVNYITIQKYRYGDMFEIHYNIPSDYLHHKTLRFILQPIVENSIIHGFENMTEDKCLITIAASVNDDFIITIADNGHGIEANTLEGLLHVDSNKNKMHNGIGLVNIDERIKLYFGFAYGLSFKSTLGLGTTVEIKLPIITSTDDFEGRDVPFF